MKRKFALIFIFLAIPLLLFPACAVNNAEADAFGSLKYITKPYIAQYECVEARLGDIDLLEKYEYMRIIFVDGENMTFEFKPKGGEKRSFDGKYTLDNKTRELEGEIGVLGFKFREKVILQNGKFALSLPFLGKELTVKFRMN